MGARLTILYNPDLGEQSLDAEALRWCQRIIEDFKDWPNHHDLMVAKIYLGDLYCSRNGREGLGKATRLYWDVIEVPEDEIVFDDPETANLNLDKIAIAKARVGRQIDAKGRFLTEPTEEMNMDHREVLLSRRRESTRALRLAAIRALGYKQGVPGDRQKTRERLLELKQRRPDDKLYQETLDTILRGFPANAEKTAPGRGQGATSRQLLASPTPDGASTQPAATVQPVPAGPGKQRGPQTQPGGAAAPWEVRIAGSVVDNNGWPIEGAAVRLITWDAAKGAMVLKHETQSAADGSFGMRVPAWVYRGRVVADKDGFAHDWMSVPACPLLPAIRLKLEKPATIAGRIVDGGGKPIRGATVTATTNGPGYMSGDVSGSDHLDWLIARSDEHGRFKLPGLRPNSSVDLSTQAAGFAEMERATFAKAGQQDVTITMLPAGRIEGKVIDADTDKPLAGVGLWAGEFGYRDRRPRGGACVSDEQGRFVIDGLPSGQYGMRVGLGAWVSNGLLQMESVIVDVKAGTAAKAGVISLRKGNMVEVQVLDAVNGKPVMEAGVTAIDGSGQDMSFKFAGADGVCKLYLPAAASPRLRITERNNYKQLITQPVEVRKGQARRLVFRLERDNWATGKVLNRDGSGAADVIVGLYPKLREEYGATGADGSFGVGTSCVDDKGSAIVVVRDVKRNLAGWAKLDTDRPAEIRLSPGATLSGRVVDGQGKPVPGASLQIMAPAKDAKTGGSGFEWNVVAGPDGCYEIKAVAPGLRYGLMVRARAHEEAACVVDVPADASGREVKVEHVVIHNEGF
jgi:protocatechuate 3,4-dioxygenase beta subunit